MHAAAEGQYAVATVEADRLRRTLGRIEREIEDEVRKADRVAAATGPRALKGEDRLAFMASTQRAAELATRSRSLTKRMRKAEKRAAGARVVSEPRTYSKTAEHSFFIDAGLLTLGVP
jgi:benzoyl-CoA reductase/2-hydroxyglutaryl-CoA dehydratase subunit BcrC/BadD/HgdB